MIQMALIPVSESFSRAYKSRFRLCLAVKAPTGNNHYFPHSLPKEPLWPLKKRLRSYMGFLKALSVERHVPKALQVFAQQAQ